MEHVLEMAPFQTRVVAATLVGITASTFFVGANMALSYLAMPALVLPASPSSSKSPSPKAVTPSPHLAKQWSFIYDRAAPVAIAITGISTASFTYAAMQLPATLSMQRNLLIAAASMAFIVGPFTLTVIMPTNSVLKERANASDIVKDVGEAGVIDAGRPKAQDISAYRTDELIIRWARLSYLRATMPTVAVFCAIAALFY